MKKYFFIYIAGLGLLSSSCKKILEQKPEASLDPISAYGTRTGVEAGLIGVYDGIQAGNHYGLNLWIFADLYADNLTHTGTFPTYAQIANKQILADNTDGVNTWNTIYNNINRANNIIFYAPQISDPAFNKNSALGEARCLRAFCYFDLIRFYGGSPNGYGKTGGLGVPLYLTPTLSPADAAPKPRATEAEVYTAILSDLDFAIANLPANIANGRVNKNVAIALKARVQLYREQWDDAETLATQVLSAFNGDATGGLGVSANYANLWLSKNTKPESLWELQYFADDRNFGAFYFYPGANGGRNEITSSTSLKNAHEAGDLRLPINVTVAATGIPANKTRKFNRVAGDDNIILFRLAELYLIRAEARARKATPDIAGAQADINKIRTRAGLANTTAATSTALVSAVEAERRVELAFEGHRWFDLRRYDKISTVGITQTFRALWPIPLREVQTSGGVVAQNPNY
jgi:starch-binding outer membrane protein, SusD/RagB family